MATLATKSGALILKDGKVAQNCACCTPTFCCASGSPPPFLEFAISGFTSSRGTFTDFDPNRTFLLPTPAVTPFSGPFGTGDGSPVTSPPSCLLYGGFELSYDQALWNIANTQGCVERKIASNPPVWTWLWSIQLGSDPPSGAVDADGNLFVAVLLQSRTDDFENQIALIDTTPSSSRISLGINRQQFIDAACDKSLSISGSHSGSHRTLAPTSTFPFSGCLNTLGSYSFDWTLAVSNLT